MRRFTVTLILAAMLVACSDEVPEELVQIEGAGEDAYDRALENDVGAVASDAEKLQSTWQSFRSEAISDGAREQDARALDLAIASLADAASGSPEPPALARAANGISAPMDELFRIYDPAVPADVLGLDYLGREVALDGMDRDLTRASADIDRIVDVWKALRPVVVDAGGSAEAGRYDASIAKERSAVEAADAKVLVDEANAQLELVDALERVFEDSGDAPD